MKRNKQNHESASIAVEPNYICQKANAVFQKQKYVCMHEQTRPCTQINACTCTHAYTQAFVVTGNEYKPPVTNAPYQMLDIYIWTHIVKQLAFFNSMSKTEKYQIPYHISKKNKSKK